MMKATKRRRHEATKGKKAGPLDPPSLRRFVASSLSAPFSSPSSLRRSVASSLHPAFTLVELMISIALVLLLMIGINQVFKTTGEAVGTGTAIATGIRDSRSAQSVLAEDLGAAADGPALIIWSERVSAFRNRADMAADKDFNPADGSTPRERQKRTIDLDGDGLEGNATVPGEIISPAIYNDRSHRVDQLRFFARGLFRRQTGGAMTTAGGGMLIDEFTSSVTSSEAFIWFGHLKRPDVRTLVANNSKYAHADPGQDPDPTPPANEPQFNDDNFFATDWILGRVPLLLLEGTDTDSDGIGDEMQDANGNYLRFIERKAALVDNTTASPLVQQVSDNGPSSDSWDIQWSRFDLANTSIQQYRTILSNYIGGPTNVTTPWYRALGLWRFHGDPRPSRPLDASSMARTAPVFIEHCTQFIVEYAGDFLNQDPMTGAIIDFAGNPAMLADADTDDQIDFILTGTGTDQTRTIRWYGLPRNVNTSDDIGGPRIRGTANDPNELIDVVPLRDVVLATSGATIPGTAPYLTPDLPWCERQLPPRVANYAHATAGLQPLPIGPGGHRYIAAWGPDNTNFPRPKLIRIVFTIDDPLGRIAEGQTFEYVFKVGE